MPAGRPPIIVIGAHRSGTSVFTQMLEAMGVFMGWKQDMNDEATFFKAVNEWVLRSAGGSWDNPAPSLRYSDADHKVIADYLGDLLASPRSVTYLGSRSLRHRDPRRLTEPWGWKDPRNTFTLPIWLELMPDARVVHVVRNGIDVANSLKVRADVIYGGRLEKARRRKSLRAVSWMRPKRGGFVDSVRASTLGGAFEIWEEYVDRGHEMVSLLPEDRAMEIRFEDLVADPSAVLERAAAIIGGPGLDLSAATRLGDSSRSLAYRDDPVLSEFAASVADRLHARGY
jgi:hypothetical protein